MQEKAVISKRGYTTQLCKSQRFKFRFIFSSSIPTRVQLSKLIYFQLLTLLDISFLHLCKCVRASKMFPFGQSRMHLIPSLKKKLTHTHTLSGYCWLNYTLVLSSAQANLTPNPTLYQKRYCSFCTDGLKHAMAKVYKDHKTNRILSPSISRLDLGLLPW